ncbi:hypothetical protein D3C78_532160 [compost metagenome]
MGGDAVLLLLQARVVDDHRDTEGDHEQHRQRQQAHDQRDHQQGGQDAVEPQQFGTAGIRELRDADFTVIDFIARQMQFAQASALTLAIHVGDGQQGDDTGEHGRDHRYEDIRRVDMQGTGGASGRATPGGHVHDAAGENDQAGHDPRAHAQAAVQRQHGRHADHVGGGAVAVQRHYQGQHCRADRDFQRVAFDQLEDLAYGRVKQAGVDHQGEIQDSEHQHDPGRRQFADAFEHHWADLGGKTAEQGEQNRYQDQRDQGRQALGHDQVHEGDDHGEAEEGQHGSTPGVARRRKNDSGGSARGARRVE